MGRWTVPGKFFSVVYKGSGLLDLRAADLTAAVTTIVAVSYKSRTQILLPPGVRVELGGTGVSTIGDADALADSLTAHAPVVRIKGVAYKGSIEAGILPPGGRPLEPPRPSSGDPQALR